jgi:adenylate cyclase
MLENEELTFESLNACRGIIDNYIELNNGRIFHTAGDSVLAEFSGPLDAVNAAISFQDALFEKNKANTGDETKIVLNWRVGIHCDDVIFENDNVYGNGVNIAARLESQCEPGQILVSKMVNEIVASRIEAISRAAGTKKLKNISNEFEVFAISTEKTEQIVLEAKNEVLDETNGTKKPILCVLPFKNMNANEDSTFLIDGIYEDIITELSMVRQISVVSRQSSVNFTEGTEDLDNFIEQFNLDYLIQGSARSSGNRVRVTLSLLDTQTNEVVWSKKFDRETSDIFEVQDEIVRSVMFKILGEIELVSLNRAKRKPTENMSSYEYLLRGKEMHHKFEAAANADALKFFDRAIESDSENAQAYAWKACTYGQGLARGFIKESFDDAIPKFTALLEKAMLADPNDYEVHRLLSGYYDLTGKFKLSEQHAKKAFDAVPNDPRILQQYGEALLKTKQTKKGCDLTLLALEYDPVPQGQSNSDKRKADAVFACFMDDRIELGLKIAEEIEVRNDQTLIFAAGLAAATSQSLVDFDWLLSDIKAADKSAIETTIDKMGKIDIVIQNKLREVYTEMVKPLMAAA